MHPALRKGPLFYKKTPHFISCLWACKEMSLGERIWLAQASIDPVQMSADSILIICYRYISRIRFTRATLCSYEYDKC